MALCTSLRAAALERWMEPQLHSLQQGSPPGPRDQGLVPDPPGLFFPALGQAGLHPKRVMFVQGDREEDVAATVEEALSYGGLGAVVGGAGEASASGSGLFKLRVGGAI